MGSGRGARELVGRSTSWAASAVLRAGSAARRMLRRLAEQETPSGLLDAPRSPVVVYFTGGPHVRYQLTQWLPVLEALAAETPVLVVGRGADDVRGLPDVTSLPVAVAPTLDDLVELYRRVDAKVVLYPNNAVLNFQSLIYRDALHVHINHGESDKVSMVSNQAKAYDRVVVAGRAALERHERALIDFDASNLVVCGRPQLDLDRALAVDVREDVRTVLYAPTWSGEDETNNYTSVDLYGPAIVEAALGSERVRVVYKPHPRVLTTQVPAVEAAHRSIVRLLESARAAHPERGHLFLPQGDVLATFDAADLLVTDVSSVGLDFLYLRSDAPIVLTDRRTDRAALRTAAPIAAASDVVDAGTVADVAGILARNLGTDPHGTARLEAREHYFGLERGESSRRFRALVDRTILDRDQAVGARARAAGAAGS